MSEPIITYEIDGFIATLEHRTCELPGGRIGYFQLGNEPEHGCLTAAVATATQTPLEDLPPMLDAGDLLMWADPLGWELDIPEAPPVDAPLWIGITPPIRWDGKWKKRLAHTVVMERNRILFDPASGWEFENGERCPLPTEIEKAYVLTKREEAPC